MLRSFARRCILSLSLTVPVIAVGQATPSGPIERQVTACLPWGVQSCADVRLRTTSLADGGSRLRVDLRNLQGWTGADPNASWSGIYALTLWTRTPTNTVDVTSYTPTADGPVHGAATAGAWSSTYNGLMARIDGASSQDLNTGWTVFEGIGGCGAASMPTSITGAIYRVGAVTCGPTGATGWVGVEWTRPEYVDPRGIWGGALYFIGADAGGSASGGSCDFILDPVGFPHSNAPCLVVRDVTTIAPTTAPEPSTLTLFMVGLTVCAMLVRRRAARAVHKLAV